MHILSKCAIMNCYYEILYPFSGERVLKLHLRRSDNRKGFTLVELTVVLAILAILAAMIGGALTAWVRLSRFEKNEANARTVYQAAQIAMTRRQAAGTLEDWLKRAAAEGVLGAGYGGQDQQVQKRVRALFYDRQNPDTAAGRLVRELLDDYTYDASLWDASLCVEVDVTSGRVYSVFYASGEDRLRFGEPLDITDRSYEHRRGESLVGYYGTGLVDVVSLKQIKLKVRSQQLVNGETLTMNWSGNSRGQDMDVTYEVVFYDADADKKLFSVQVDLLTQSLDPAVQFSRSNPVAMLPVTRYNADGSVAGEKTCLFPLSYEGGRFTLTLDAMMSADILEKAGDEGIRTGSLFSITRFVDGPVQLEATVQAFPNEQGEQEYTPSKVSSPSNQENALFGGVSANKATLSAFRHLYNLRFAGEGQLTAVFGKKRLDWTDGSVVVYQPSELGKPPQASIPGADKAVAFPAIPEWKQNQTLAGSGAVLRNVQLRTESVAGEALYAGLFSVNRGTIENLTLENPDMAVNLAKAYADKAAVDAAVNAAAQGIGAAQKRDMFLPSLRGAGALCGLNTGTITGCKLDLTGTGARVAAAVAFGENPAADDAATDKQVLYQEGTNTVQVGEVRGVGGLAGIVRSAVTGEASGTCTVTGLTVTGRADSSGVIGLLVPLQAEPASTDKTEHAHYNTASTGYLPVGIGGAAGVVAVPKNAFGTVSCGVNVTGNGYTGGVAGSMLGVKEAVAFSGLEVTGNGSVTASRSWTGGSLGQFFGGVTGYLNHAALEKAVSAAGAGRYSLEVDHATSGTRLTGDTLPGLLKGDFVGGIAGFARNATLKQCSTVQGRVTLSGGAGITARGFVLGRRFVGGLLGGSSASSFTLASGANNSHVFGQRYVGGIVAVNGSGCTVANAVNNGLVAGIGENAAYVGGIAGIHDGSWGGDGSAVLESCSVVWNQEFLTGEERLETYYHLLAQLGADQADFVGGLAGYVGKNGSIKTPDDMTVVLVGRDFVGGLAGCLAKNAGTLETTAVEGRVLGRDCVGGLLGFSGKGELPNDMVSAVVNVRGHDYVGGVLGAWVTDKPKDFQRARTTRAVGTVSGDSMVGGVAGYLRSAASVAGTGADEAEQLRSLLPKFENGVLTLPGGGSGPAVSLTGFANQCAVSGGSFTGGVVGICEGAVTLSGASNSGRLQCAVTGDFSGETANAVQTLARWDDTLNDRITLWNTDGWELDRAAFLGVVIGLCGEQAALTDCTNSGVVYGTANGVGGIAGLNLGALQGCTNSASQGDSFKTMVGGIAGVNGGRVFNCTTSACCAVTAVQHAGGAVGVNLKNGSLELQAGNLLASVSASSQCAGGAVGTNLGTITAAEVGSQSGGLTVTAVDNAGGVAGDNRGTIQGALTVHAGVSVTARRDNAGGVAGLNSGTVSNAGGTLQSSAAVRTNGSYAGGIAGLNTGTITGAQGGGTISAARNAGGIAGRNEGTIQNGLGGGTITALGGAAGGVTAVNAGTVNDTAVKSAVVHGYDEAIGLVAAVNESNEKQSGTITGVTVSGGTLRGKAAVAGGIAGHNQGTVQNSTVTAITDLTGLSARGGSLTLGGAVGRNGGAVSGITSEVSLTDDSGNYQHLGGVAGENNGILNQCVWTGTLDAAASRDKCTLGGIVGLNTGTASGCAVGGSGIVQAAGSFNGDESYSPEQMLASASHVGGIAGQNTGTLENCLLGTADVLTKVSAKYGFVGGVAGSNSGTITGCGGISGEIETLLNTLDTRYADAVAMMKTGSYQSLCGTDVVKQYNNADYIYTDTANRCVVALRGGTGTDRGEGDLGGITGYNTDSGLLTGCATGKWMVYGDNVTRSSAVGGLIGRNESNRDNRVLMNFAAVRRYTAGWNQTRDVSQDKDDWNNEHAVVYAGTGVYQRNTYYNDYVDNECFVGGVIGVQENRTGTSWTLSEIINAGSVFNSRSNYQGGIIAHWKGNSGTLKNAANFGGIYTNANTRMVEGKDTSNGAAGGIVSYVYNPNNGASMNIVGCENHGEIRYFTQDSNAGSNECAGIVGKASVLSAADSLTINIVDCVNTGVIYSRSLAVGIFGWLGGGNVEGVTLNFVRCRNFGTDFHVANFSGDSANARMAGILGARQHKSRELPAPTTFTDCFTLYDHNGEGGDEWRLMGATEKTPSGEINTLNFTVTNCYYMDAESFAQSPLTGGLGRDSGQPTNEELPYIASYRLLDCFDSDSVKDVTNQKRSPDFEGWVYRMLDGFDSQEKFQNTRINTKTTNLHAKFTLTLNFSEPVTITSVAAVQQFQGSYPIKHSFKLLNVPDAGTVTSKPVQDDLVETPVYQDETGYTTSSLTIELGNVGDHPSNKEARGREWMGISELVITTREGYPLRLKADAANTVDGARLYAGKDSTAAEKPFFAAYLDACGMKDIDPLTSHIVADGPFDSGSIWKFIRNANDTHGALLLDFASTNGKTVPAMADVTDEVLRAYYALLDERELGAPQNIQVRRSEETANIYGRYEVSWQPPARGSATSYVVTIYHGEHGADKSTFQQLGEPFTVYETRATFASNADLCGQDAYVKVLAVNGSNTAPAVEPSASSDVFTFAQAMPTPKVTIRLEEGSQYLVLEPETVQWLEANADALGDWKVVAQLVSTSKTVTFTPSPTKKQPNGEMRSFVGPVTSATALRAWAEPGEGLRSWYRSEQLNEPVSVPQKYPAGTLTAKAAVTGNSDRTLAVQVDFTFNRTGVIPPVYQALLLAKCTDAKLKIGDASLENEYVVVAQSEPVTMQETRHVVFDDLPAALWQSYDIGTLTVVVLPVSSGSGPVYTWRTATQNEVTNAMKQSADPVWKQGWQIIAGEDGFTFRRSTPLQEAATSGTSESLWRSDGFGLSLLDEVSIWEATAYVQDGALQYDFSWDAVDNATGYEVTLEGKISDTDDIWETIAIPQVSGTALNGVPADGWQYSAVRLTVTAMGSGKLGRTTVKIFDDLVQRLPAVAAPSAALDEQRSKLEYTIRWLPLEGVPADALKAYEVFAVKLDENGSPAADPVSLGTTTNTELKVDLERYYLPGTRLNLYVTAKASDGQTRYVDSLPGGVTLLPVANRLARPQITGMTLTVEGGAAVTADTTVPAGLLYNGLELGVTVNDPGASVDHKVQVWYYDTLEAANAAATAGPSGSGRLLDRAGLSQTLVATWEDAGKYMVVGVQAFNQSDVSSFWTYQVYSVPLPTMQLPSCAPEINIVTQSVPITVGDGSDSLPAMKLRAVEWRRPTIAAEAAETYTVTLTHAGNGILPLTITIRVNRDGSIAGITQPNENGWTETITGQYRDSNGASPTFTMTLRPTVSELRETTGDGESRVVGYRVTLADIADFDQSVQDAASLNRVFTSQAAVTAAPAAGTTPGTPPLLASSGTETVNVQPNN